MSIQCYQTTNVADPITLPVAQASYGAPNDFGRVIHELLFSKSTPGSSDRFLRDVRLVAEKEGFEVKESRDACPVRDYRLMVKNDEFISPNVSDEVHEAVSRCAKRSVFCKEHGYLLSHRKGEGVGMGALAKFGKDLVLSNEKHPNELPLSAKSQFSHMYFEGGNMFIVTGPDGKARVICGQDNLIITHQMMRLSGLFREKSSEKFNKGDYLSNLYSEGRIPALILEIGKKIAADISSKTVENTLSEMASMGLVATEVMMNEEQRQKGKEIAVNYLAQRKFIEETLIPKDLKVEADQMVYLPQIDYHLDCLMAPGPHGTILLQDYEQSILMLQSVKKKLTDRKDQELADEFIDITKRDKEKVKGIMQKTRQMLEQAGLTVIPTPGAFFGLSKPDENKKINFFNAITGFSPKTNHFYYIVGGTSMGVKLGALLMDAYAQFLQSLCPDRINLYFVGRNPRNPADFSLVDEVSNDLDLLMGAHCLSLETKISQSQGPTKAS